MREDAITQIYEKPLRGDLVRRSASCDDPAEQMSPPALNADREFFAEFLDWRVAVDEAMRGVQLIFYASNIFRESDSLGSMRRLLSRDGMHTMNFHTDDDVLAAVQTKLSLADRDLVARAIAAQTNKRFDNPYRGEKNKAALAELTDTGLIRAPIKVSAEMCNDVVRYFKETPCYSAHVPAASDGVPHRVSDVAAISNYGSYTLEQNILAPHLMELALDKSLLDLAGGYLGCVPSLYSINTFWTFPIADAGVTHLYHRDVDDFRFLAVFVYWTDVTKGEGEFYYIQHSHNREWLDSEIKKYQAKPFNWSRLNVSDVEEFHKCFSDYSQNNDSLYEKLFRKDLQTVCGPRGTAIISDTFNLHKGSLPATRPRLVTWFRYGLYANDAYRNDKTAPVDPSILGTRIAFNDLNRFICRLIIS